MMNLFREVQGFQVNWSPLCSWHWLCGGMRIDSSWKNLQVHWTGGNFMINCKWEWKMATSNLGKQSDHICVVFSVELVSVWIKHLEPDAIWLCLIRWRKNGGSRSEWYDGYEESQFQPTHPLSENSDIKKTTTLAIADVAIAPTPRHIQKWRMPNIQEVFFRREPMDSMDCEASFPA